MNWLIKASTNNVWSDFKIEVTADLVFEAGSIYQLDGDNGTGKTSFIKKVLIPEILLNPDRQYLMYIEQQIQSQFDVVKAYAALQKPAVQIHTFTDMVDYQLYKLSQQLITQSKPCFIIIDESSLLTRIVQTLSRLKVKQYCLVYVSHQKCEIPVNKEILHLKIESINTGLSRI